jgi:hypothetical protein
MYMRGIRRHEIFNEKIMAAVGWKPAGVEGCGVVMRGSVFASVSRFKHQNHGAMTASDNSEKPGLELRLGEEDHCMFTGWPASWRASTNDVNASPA